VARQSYHPVRDLAIDDQDRVFLAGGFVGEMTFEHTTIQAKGVGDGFIAEYDGSGALHWAAPTGVAGDAVVNGVALASNGDLVLTGGLNGLNPFSLEPATTASVFYSFFAARWTPSLPGEASFRGIRVSTDHIAHMTLIGGASGATYILEGSTDLKVWTPLTSSLPSDGLVNLIDPSAPSHQFRFYRARTR
jgi:hypothetical protein